jgi:HdeA/HdeB family
MKSHLIGLVLAASLGPAVANAEVIINMAAFSCEEYLSMSPAMSRDFSAWMSGWFSYQTRRTFVDVVAHEQNTANLRSWCQLHPQASVMNALESAIGPH